MKVFQFSNEAVKDGVVAAEIDAVTTAVVETTETVNPVTPAVMCCNDCGNQANVAEDLTCGNCGQPMCSDCDGDGLNWCNECSFELEEQDEDEEQDETPVTPATETVVQVIPTTAVKTTWKLSTSRAWLGALDELVRATGEPSRAALFERLVEEEGSRRGVVVPSRLEADPSTPYYLRRPLPGQTSLRFAE